MAHPMAEKAKEVGLRYGDKAAVVLTSLLFVVCFAAALSMQSIQLTPEEVKKEAEAADANLRRHQDRDAIIQKLEGDGIKVTNFAKDAEDSTKIVLVADNYKPTQPWVSPEPGAGLIRDTPTLIAPTELYAYPGRGGALVYDLDENGNRKIDTEKKEPPKAKPRKRKKRRSSGGMMGGMGGMGGRRTKKSSRKSQTDIEREQKEDYARKQKELRASLAGADKEQPEEKGKEQEKAEGPGANQQYKEITKGLRWVAITGVLDHAKLVTNYREALKFPGAAPHYFRLDLERQIIQKDGTWSKWEAVDADENYKILDNLPEEQEELAPTTVLPENLVDPLPFLKAGLYEKVHIASLVPKEKKEIKPPPTMGGMGGMGGMGSSMGGSMGGMGMMQDQMMRGMSGMGGGGGRGVGSGSMGAMGAMGGMGDVGGRSGMGAMGGLATGGGDAGNYWKSDEKRIMIRALDFTPQPDNRYRYRSRIVVFNPNYNRDDISPGVDNKSKELTGPWSEPTDEIGMPADVSAYAMSPVPAGPKSDMKAWFQVISFDLKEGVTVTKTFMGGPGEGIGDVSSAGIPTSEGTGAKSKRVDFNTHNIVLDVTGGMQALPAGFPGGGLERPALALLLKQDGSVMARLEVDDLNNEVRKDIDKNYKRELKESDKKRENSASSGYGSMMGSMMGGMGGGMGARGAR